MVTELSGDAVKFSRFGSAIGNIGDINRDSYNGECHWHLLKNDTR